VVSEFRVRGLQVSLGGRLVLHNISFGMRKGWTVIVGPTGSGKSTLLRALAGQIAPAAGSVRLDGRDLADMPEPDRRRRIAWMGQGDTCPDLTIHEAFTLGRFPDPRLEGRSLTTSDAIIDELMGLGEHVGWPDRRLQDLSHGERHRVMLSRALASKAPVLLLDEPTLHLDPANQIALARLLRRLSVTRTIVSVLHDLPLALQADRILVLHCGSVKAHGRYDDPSLHEVLIETFAGTIRIDCRGPYPMPLLLLDD
jgi:cobalamin transport system ATP-binding protein